MNMFTMAKQVVERIADCKHVQDLGRKAHAMIATPSDVVSFDGQAY
jgi:hypothetical protein